MTHPKQEPLPIDEVALKVALSKLGAANIMNHWELDEGNLGWFIGHYEQARTTPTSNTACDDAAFQAFMLAYHEHGGTALGFRKCLAAYDAAKAVTIDSALAKAAEILANFKGEPHSTKLEEWQACYAHLFRQMTQLVETSRMSTPNASKNDDNLNTSGEHVQSLNSPNAELVELVDMLETICWMVQSSFVHNKSDIIKSAREKLAKLGALKEGKP